MLVRSALVPTGCVVHEKYAQQQQRERKRRGKPRDDCISWFRFVDDVFAIIKRAATEHFLEHLNRQNNAIQFTIEREKNGELPFMDTTVCWLPNGKLATNTYGKPTHTGRFLQYNSDHLHKVKAAVATSLLRRVDNISLSEEAKRQETERVLTELAVNRYPENFLRREQRKHQRKIKNDAKQNPRDNRHSDTSPTICATSPYIKGVSKAIRRVLAPLDIVTACSGRKKEMDTYEEGKG